MTGGECSDKLKQIVEAFDEFLERTTDISPEDMAIMVMAVHKIATRKDDDKDFIRSLEVKAGLVHLLAYIRCTIGDMPVNYKELH